MQKAHSCGLQAGTQAQHIAKIMGNKFRGKQSWQQKETLRLKREAAHAEHDAEHDGGLETNAFDGHEPPLAQPARKKPRQEKPSRKSSRIDPPRQPPPRGPPREKPKQTPAAELSPDSLEKRRKKQRKWDNDSYARKQERATCG